MHLLYFHQHFTTPDGCTGTRSYEISQRLLASGHRVTMVCGAAALSSSGLSGPFIRGRREGSVDGIHVIELELPYSNYDGFLLRSWTFLRFAFRSIMLTFRLDYDVVFATSTPLTAALPGIFARWIRRLSPREANPVPATKRTRGPKLRAAVAPTKWRPGIELSKPWSMTGNPSSTAN